MIVSSLCVNSWLLGNILRDETVISRFLEHEMHMTWAVRMPLEPLQELTNWSIIWNRIRNRHNGFEVEGTLLVALQHGTTVWPRPLCILHVVETFRVGFPHVYRHALEGTTFGVLD